MVDYKCAQVQLQDTMSALSELETELLGKWAQEHQGPLWDFIFVSLEQLKRQRNMEATGLPSCEALGDMSPRERAGALLATWTLIGVSEGIAGVGSVLHALLLSLLAQDQVADAVKEVTTDALN